MRQVDPKLLELLVCPIAKTTLTYDRERQELISRAARCAYPIVDGVPILIIDESRPLADDELAAPSSPIQDQTR